MRDALTDKLIVLGVDGMDPRITKKYVDNGMMPNLKKFIEKGAAREDLVMLGNVPTVTPPMWTTLATGATAATHGLTCFWNQHPTKLDTMIYSLDSKLCKAELLWNVLVEAGKKTLVWHWPGSSWPPTSDNPNLHVVDGGQPGAVNMGVAIVDGEKMVTASTEITELEFIPAGAKAKTGAGCVITDLDEEEDDPMKQLFGGAKEVQLSMLDVSDGEIAILGNMSIDNIQSPIKPASGWVKELGQDQGAAPAKEMTILTSGGGIRRPCLILSNKAGVYDTVEVYRSKKETEPLTVLRVGETAFNVVDEALTADGKKMANKHLRLINLAEDGSTLKIWISAAYDIENDHVWHPKSLYKDIVENVGLVPPPTMLTGSIPENVTEAMIPCWQFYVPWQADCLEYLMTNKDYDVIFSHIHHVDNMGHQIWHYAKHNKHWPEGHDEKLYQGFIDEAYKMTDEYFGRFLPYVDQGWTVIITSDHGLIVSEEHPSEIIGQPGGVNLQFMEKLGFTTTIKDQNGQPTKAIDWTKTKAIANRANHIYINLKGKYETGIVEPADKYDLEDQIITAMYHYQDPATGKRVVELALRNKEAELLGMNGPENGDIVYFLAEGFNAIHCDSLSTHYGYYDSSVSPLFIAAGPGIKQGFTTKRVIRQVDVAPTIAVLTGVRMPNECEGAPVYQILSEQY